MELTRSKLSATLPMGSSSMISLVVRVPSVPVCMLEHPKSVKKSANINAFNSAPHSATYIATAGDNCQALIWDTKSPLPSRKMEFWVDQASRFRCSLATASGGSVQVRELATKAEVFDTIRTGNAEWSEDALLVLDGWMRMGEGWNKQNFGGSGGSPMEGLMDNSLLALPERGETEKRSGVEVLNDGSDTEDQNDLLQDLRL